MKKWTNQELRKIIVDTFRDVYDIFKIQSNHDLSPKQEKFIRLLINRIQGREVKENVIKPMSSEDVAVADITLKCPKCGKVCSSRSGMTLHVKRCS